MERIRTLVGGVLLLAVFTPRIAAGVEPSGPMSRESAAETSPPWAVASGSSLSQKANPEPVCSSLWTELGPRFAGRVSGIVATDPSHLYVSTPGGGVWKSTNGGSSFVWAGNVGLGNYTTLNLYPDKVNPSRLFLLTWSGFLVSNDGGGDWTRTLYSMPQGDTPYRIPSYTCGSWPACPPFAGRYTAPSTPFAQIAFTSTTSLILTSLPCQGLQYSIDDGDSFHQLWPFTDSTPLERNPDNCIDSIAVDGSTHQVWFSTMADSTIAHVYRSHEPWTANGPPVDLSWDLVNTGLDSVFHTVTRLVWGGAPNRLMAIGDDGSEPEPYLFTGGKWIEKPWNNASSCPMYDVRPLVWGGGDDFFAGGPYFAYTTDAGDHWTCPDLRNLVWVDFRAIFPDPQHHNLFVGTDQNGLGAQDVMARFTWSPGSAPTSPVGIKGSGIHSWQASTIAKVPGRNRLLVGAADTDPACSDNGGTTWQVFVADETAGFSLSRGNGDVAYAYSILGTLWKSTNVRSASTCGSLTFTDVSPPQKLQGVRAFPTSAHTIAVGPENSQEVFLLSDGVLYSTDGGASWSVSNLPVYTSGGRSAALTALMADESGVLYVGVQSHGVYSCSDTTHFCDGSAGAGNWTPFALNPGTIPDPPEFITAITESNAPPAPRTFWIATSKGVYRRLAGASEWELVDALNRYPYSDVVVDPTCPTRIYTAVGWLSDILRTRGGIHVSTDNGATWTSLTSGYPLHNTPVTQVVVNTENPREVFATTYGRGAWMFTWPALPPCQP